MTTATQSPSRERAEKRRRRFRGARSTRAQRELMKAGNPMEKVHAKYRTKIVFHCHHRCYLCGGFVAKGGGCPGVKQSNPKSTPICWRTKGTADNR